MNEYTLEKIADDARDQESLAAREADGQTMCESCGFWDDRITLVDVADGIDPTCEACAIDSQSGPDPILPCAYCASWDYWADGWHPTNGESDDLIADSSEVWVCHFCAINRADDVNKALAAGEL